MPTAKPTRLFEGCPVQLPGLVTATGGTAGVPIGPFAIARQQFLGVEWTINIINVSIVLAAALSGSDLSNSVTLVANITVAESLVANLTLAKSSTAALAGGPSGGVPTLYTGQFQPPQPISLNELDQLALQLLLTITQGVSGWTAVIGPNSSPPPGITVFGTATPTGILAGPPGLG